MARATMIDGVALYKQPWYGSYRSMMDRCYRKTSGNYKFVDWYRHNEVWYQCDDCGWEGPSVYSGGFADTEQARLAWNTRAPILSAEELKKLEENT